MANHGKKPASQFTTTVENADTSDEYSELEIDETDQTPGEIDVSALQKALPDLFDTDLIGHNKILNFGGTMVGHWVNKPAFKLSAMVYNNSVAPRPYSIEPALLRDLSDIKCLVEVADIQGIRAACGITTTGLNTMIQSKLTKNPPVNRLSKEQIARIQQLAVQRLAYAYRLHETLAFILLFQTEISKIDIGLEVLETQPGNVDAMYVHYFRKAMSVAAKFEQMDLEPLNKLIQLMPQEPAYYRSRAHVKIAKGDFSGAIRDITEALRLDRMFGISNRHKYIHLLKDVGDISQDLIKEDRSSSLRNHLLYLRGMAHLQLAYSHIDQAMVPEEAEPGPSSAAVIKKRGVPAKKSKQSDQLEATTLVRKHTDAALRDFTSFISIMEYAPGFSEQEIEAIVPTLPTRVLHNNVRSRPEALLVSIKIDEKHRGSYDHSPKKPQTWNLPPSVPSRPPIYTLDVLLNLNPSNSQAPISLPEVVPDHIEDKLMVVRPDLVAATTFHPLLTDTLHGILMCHFLLRTPAEVVRRHLVMVGRVLRVAAGGLIFRRPGSSIQADWWEINRRLGDWVGVGLREKGNDKAWDDIFGLGTGGGGPPEEGEVGGTRIGDVVRWVRQGGARRRV